MAIELIDKIAPKNDGFVGMVDADQVIGGGDAGTLPNATVSESNVTQHGQEFKTTSSPEFANLKVTNGGIIQVGNDATSYIKFNSTDQQWEFYVGDELRGAF